MKNKILLLIAGISIMLSSCSKDYLQLYPNSSVDGNAVFSSVEGAWGAINGIHRSMYKQYYDASCGGVPGLYLHTEVLADDIILSTKGRGFHVSPYQWLHHNVGTTTLSMFPWRMIYQVISNSNAIINNIDAIVGDVKELNAIKAQALIYRAWGYHQLVQIYGKRYIAGQQNTQLGVPVYTEVVFTAKARNTVEDVYTQINSDLDNAIILLDGYSRTNKSHMDQSVAKGLKARVALAQGNWSVAQKFAEEARAGYKFMSTQQQLEGYNDYTNPEYMWGSHVQSDQTLYWYSYYAYMACNFTTTDIICIPKSLYNTISDTDIRKNLWWPTAGNNGPKPAMINPTLFPTNYMNSKFLSAGSGDTRGDFPYMRTAEMYLIEAEAYTRLGKNTEARSVLFLLANNRDPKYTKSTKTDAALLEEILLQRRVELWGEGFRWFDLKRMNVPMKREIGNGKDGGHDLSLCGFEKVEASDNGWEWAIPNQEIESNPYMEKNP